MTFHKSCALLDEMSVSEPVFRYRKGTPQRGQVGQVWDSIAANLNAIEYPKFKVLKRSCRDRWRRRRKTAAKQIRKKAMERLGESSKRCGADGEVEVKKKKKKSSRRKSSSQAVEFLRDKEKLDNSLREEELQLRRASKARHRCLCSTTNESSFTFSDGKNGGKAEKLEQFIYQFTSVRWFLISIWKGCNTVFLLKRSLLILKCLHMSCLIALAPMGKALSQFLILTL